MKPTVALASGNPAEVTMPPMPLLAQVLVLVERYLMEIRAVLGQTPM